MNIRKKCKIETGLEHIADSCDVPMDELIDALTGIAWDEEEAGELKDMISDETDI